VSRGPAEIARDSAVADRVAREFEDSPRKFAEALHDAVMFDLAFMGDADLARHCGSWQFESERARIRKDRDVQTAAAKALHRLWLRSSESVPMIETLVAIRMYMVAVIDEAVQAEADRRIDHGWFDDREDERDEQ
jgi:hypothetical protein